MNETPRSMMLERASGYLASQGIRVLDKDWSAANGTLDLVAADRNTLVVVQIFGRRMRHPFISRARLSRQRHLAVAWLNQHGIRFDQVRVDAVMVIHEGTGGYTIEHVRSIGA